MSRHILLTAVAALVLAACGQTAEDATPKADTSAEAGSAVTANISGEESFRKCAACHKLEKGAAHGVGPNLHGIVGRAVASAPGFNYSSALKANGGSWEATALDAYLENPRKAVPGGKMAFAGIRDAAERKALIDYLAAQK